MKYELEIVGTLRMTYVDEAAIRQELAWMRLRIHELEQRVQAPGGFIYIGYLSVYERIRNELDKKISQVEAFLSQTNGIYDGIDIYQSYIQQGIDCLGSALSDPTIETVPAVLNLAWAKALQEITPEEVKDLRGVTEVEGTEKVAQSSQEAVTYRSVVLPDEVTGEVNGKLIVLYPNDKWGIVGGGNYSEGLQKTEDGRYKIAVAPKILVPSYPDDGKIWKSDLKI